MLLPSGYGAVTRPIAMRLAPALAALATTLLAGMTGSSRPGAWQTPDSAALMAVTGLLLAGAAGIGSSWLDSPVLGTSASLAMLAAASLLLRDATRPATNDNRPVERLGAFWILPDNGRHATRASSPGLGE